MERVDPREAAIVHDPGFEEARGEALTLDDIAASLPPSRVAVVPLEAPAPFVPLRPVALTARRLPPAQRAVLDDEENRPRLRAVRRSGPPQPVAAGPSRRRVAGPVATLHAEARPSQDVRRRRSP